MTIQGGAAQPVYVTNATLPGEAGGATAANQTAEQVLIGAVTETAPATDTASSGLNGRLQRIAQRLTSLIGVLPASLGQKTAANSFAVTLASDQSALPGTLADGANSTLGAKADAAATTDSGTFSLIALTKRLLVTKLVTSQPADGEALAAWLRVATMQSRYNGSTLDMMRNNIEGTLLASAVRAATNNTADQINYNSAGVLVFCNITAVPGTDTVQFIIQAKDPASGVYINLSTDTVQVATGMRVLLVYPGAGAASGDINVVRNGPLPRTWRVRVVHSAGGNFTYSVGYALML